MAKAITACLKIMAGKSTPATADLVLDDDDFNEARDWPFEGRQAVALQYYDCYKVLALFSAGFFEAAAELGFAPWENRGLHSW